MNKFTLYLIRMIASLLLQASMISIPSGIAIGDHRHGGSGTCWRSGAAWHYHYAGYNDYEYSVPTDWKTEISQAAAAWNEGHDNSANLFFRDSRYNNRIIVRELGRNGKLAVTNVYASPTTIDRTETIFNSSYPHYPNVGGNDTKYDVQNTMTHEFGHWIMLFDQTSSSCKEATMYGYISPGETYKQTLTSWDKNGVNWQYP